MDVWLPRINCYALLLCIVQRIKGTFSSESAPPAGGARGVQCNPHQQAPPLCRHWRANRPRMLQMRIVHGCIAALTTGHQRRTAGCAHQALQARPALLNVFRQNAAIGIVQSSRGSLLQVHVASNCVLDVFKARSCMRSHLADGLRLLHMFDLQRVR